jgi:hypothetical protein
MSTSEENGLALNLSVFFRQTVEHLFVLVIDWLVLENCDVYNEMDFLVKMN